MGTVHAFLADGSEVTFGTYRVTVLWDGQPIDVEAYESNTTPLVGMALLRGYNLNIDVVNAGRVTIQALQ